MNIRCSDSGRVQPLAGAVALAAVFSLAACSGSSGPPDMTGSWTPSDGSGVKVFQGDTGPCQGIYYSDGKPLDIGGGMTCSLGSNKTNGRYPLQVDQPPNSETLYISFSGDRHATVYDSAGTQLLTMTRQ